MSLKGIVGQQKKLDSKGKKRQRKRNTRVKLRKNPPKAK